MNVSVNKNKSRNIGVRVCLCVCVCACFIAHACGAWEERVSTCTRGNVCVPVRVRLTGAFPKTSQERDQTNPKSGNMSTECRGRAGKADQKGKENGSE